MKMMGRSIVAALALVAVSLPTAANAYDDRKIGGWNLSGQNGVCSASFADGSALIILISADGGNEGGITLTDDTWEQAQTEEWGTMKMSLGKGWMDQQVNSMTDLPGYWLPYSMVRDAIKWPDKFLFRLSDAGTTIAALQLKNVKSAVAELNRCDAEVD